MLLHQAKSVPYIPGLPQFMRWNHSLSGAQLNMKISFKERGAGMLFPMNTFYQIKTLTIGGLEIQLVEVPGETHNHLVVWIPKDGTMIA